MMKKIFKYFITMVFIIALFPMKSNAEAVNYECYFNGSIIPKYKFMPGDILLPEDFEIEGTVITDKKTYGLDSLDFFITNAKNDEPVLVDEDIIIDFIIYVKEDRHYSCHFPVTVTYASFDSKVKSQLENKTFTTEKIHWKSEDGFDTIRYLDEIDKRILNAQGKEIKGTLNLSGKAYALNRGYNTVTYRFKPDDKRYDTLYGEFTVIYKADPYMVVQKDFINIHLQESKYKVYLNGKLQKDHFIGSLKSNTKYKIVVKQKNTPIGKDITIWSGTVRTKK